MRVLRSTKRFDKDVRRMKKSGKDIGELRAVVKLIVAGKPLPDRLRDHQLIGPLNDCRECHVDPDWLLIYKLAPEFIMLERTGTHARLFKK